jgi:hypothetical protein
MGVLQSMGLAGASKAIRQLFRRSDRPPAADRNASAGCREPARDLAWPPAHQADLDPSSPIEQASDAQTLITGESLSTPSTKMNRPATIIALPRTNASNVAPEQARRYDASHGSDKENQPPRIGVLVEDLDRLNLDKKNIPEPPKEAEAVESAAPLEYESDDPEVRAEKERHQRFTEEALAMVGLCLNLAELLSDPGQTSRH